VKFEKNQIRPQIICLLKYLRYEAKGLTSQIFDSLCYPQQICSKVFIVHIIRLGFARGLIVISKMRNFHPVAKVIFLAFTRFRDQDDLLTTKVL